MTIPSELLGTFNGKGWILLLEFSQHISGNYIKDPEMQRNRKESRASLWSTTGYEAEAEYGAIKYSRDWQTTDSKRSSGKVVKVF